MTIARMELEDSEPFELGNSHCFNLCKFEPKSRSAREYKERMQFEEDMFCSEKF